MRKLLLTSAITAIAFVAGPMNQADAAAITTLFNTGVDAGGATFADGTIGDLHYTLTSVPSGVSTIRIRTSAGFAPIPPWLGDNALSTWIGPNNTDELISPPGQYTYRTTFSLTELNPTTASIVGQWSIDNQQAGIFLNGVLVAGTSNSAEDCNFTLWCGFTVTSGFQYGTNTLDFRVDNLGTLDNPTGLRVEMTGTAEVPEPASMLLLGSAMAGLGILRRRKTT